MKPDPRLTPNTCERKHKCVSGDAQLRGHHHTQPITLDINRNEKEEFSFLHFSLKRATKKEHKHICFLLKTEAKRHASCFPQPPVFVLS